MKKNKQIDRQLEKEGKRKESAVYVGAPRTEGVKNPSNCNTGN